MKGSEERDYMFGRLFGYLAVIRSGRIHENDSSVALHILDRFIELYKKKSWIREVVAESILSLFEVLPKHETTFETATKRLQSSLSLDYNDLEELSSQELILFSGLQSYSKSLSEKFPSLSAILNEILPEIPIFSVENFSLLEQTLLTSCHGFPKVSYSLLFSVILSFF